MCLKSENPCLNLKLLLIVNSYMKTGKFFCFLFKVKFYLDNNCFKILELASVIQEHQSTMSMHISPSS